MSKHKWPTYRGCPDFYGPVGMKQTRIECPYAMYLAWGSGELITRLTCHEKVASSLTRVLTNISTLYNEAERRRLGFDQFGGILNVRKMRGGRSWSTHAWGCAIDLDPARNRFKWDHRKAGFAHEDCAPFIEAFQQEGWVSLGASRDFDWMHFQAVRLN
jgi:hypothetical protein